MQSGTGCAVCMCWLQSGMHGHACSSMSFFVHVRAGRALSSKHSLRTLVQTLHHAIPYCHKWQLLLCKLHAVRHACISLSSSRVQDSIVCNAVTFQPQQRAAWHLILHGRRGKLLMYRLASSIQAMCTPGLGLSSLPLIYKCMKPVHTQV